MLLEPVILHFNAQVPIAVLLAPVVFMSNARKPIAVLLLATFVPNVQ